ncbi:MAG: GNAT family N-acetyltransferase [Lachnospiraceae bacterium]|nr:GNAT family N-acetyltransferase [Lachnospiraceae bacterium]
MEKFYLEVPGIEREADAVDYIREFQEYGSPINGVGGLHRYLEDYAGWLRMTEARNVMEPTEDRCPAREYFLVRESDRRIVGMTNIRIALNERMSKYGGHIGYSIRPTERGRGYNKINLYLALKVCNRYGIETVMMDADLDNPASWRTMEALGGVRVREYFDDEESHCDVVVYHIDTEKALEEHAEFEEMVADFRLETERLFLRPMSMDDYDALYAVLADAEIMQHYPYAFDEARVRSWIERNRDRYQKYGFGLWAVCLKDSGEMIGDCGLTLQRIDGELLPEIGYHIRADQQHKGYAKEAAAAVRDWAFASTSYPALYSYCKYTNVASYKTAEAIGMRFEKEYPDEANGTTHVSIIRRGDVVECTGRE